MIQARAAGQKTVSGQRRRTETESELHKLGSAATISPTSSALKYISTHRATNTPLHASVFGLKALQPPGQTLSQYSADMQLQQIIRHFLT